jgi:transcriptional regulator with XRE-family HTH domain
VHEHRDFGVKWRDSMKQITLKGRVDDIDSFVSMRLKQRRILLGYSQQELGEGVNVSTQQVQKYEQAANRISSGRLHSFAKFLNVPIEYFFEFKNKSEKTFDSEDPEKCIQGSFDENFVDKKDVLSLVKIFREVKNQETRKKILALVKVIATMI